MQERTITGLLTIEQSQCLLQIWENITCTLAFTDHAEKLFPALRKVCSVLRSEQTTTNITQNRLARLFDGVSVDQIGQEQLSHFIATISAALPVIPLDLVRDDLSSQFHHRGESCMDLMPLVKSVSSREKHESPIRTDDTYLLNRTVESFRCQVTNTFLELDAESAKAFVSKVSDLCKLPTRDFAHIITVVSEHRPSRTRPVKHPSAFSSSNDRKIEATPIWKETLQKFTASAVGTLIQLIKNDGDELANGGEVEGPQKFPLSHDKQTRHISHYFELQKLNKEAKLHWLRRALALIRIFHDYREYLLENGYSLEDASCHRPRHGFLIGIYAGGSPDKNMYKVRLAFKEDIRYASRWMIFIRVLGFGALLVCGEAISKIVYVLC